MAERKRSKARVETPEERQSRLAMVFGETAAGLTFYFETHGLREGARLAVENGLIPAKWMVQEDRVMFEIGPEVIGLLTFEGSILFVVASGHVPWKPSELPEQPRYVLESSCEVVEAWESGKMHEHLGITQEALQERLNREGLWWLLWSVAFDGFVNRIQASAKAEVM